ncbi:hypothetical protein N658DRAFT_148741 [Parathielavia hyrcaniae]|uniref:Uncharacterized protein n=1 Tax=Parathielavia hyrcaniae TaxID=113614 RepID=A0AAN6PXQ5_9PEZI|nr:hypothetical protein N658DRAFT_148741 [Parathielavia hyrcaniae]
MRSSLKTEPISIFSFFPTCLTGALNQDACSGKEYIHRNPRFKRWCVCGGIGSGGLSQAAGSEAGAGPGQGVGLGWDRAGSTPRRKGLDTPRRRGKPRMQARHNGNPTAAHADENERDSMLEMEHISEQTGLEQPTAGLVTVRISYLRLAGAFLHKNSKFQRREFHPTPTKSMKLRHIGSQFITNTQRQRS